MEPDANGGDYILGSDRPEHERLALQHRVWRPRVLALWQRAGLSSGQTVVDVGCGPGLATLDLAELVGPSGCIVALDKSRRFIETLRAAAAQRALANIDARQIDLDEAPLPDLSADAAWCRWVLTFLARPRDVVSRLADVVRPGGTLAIHEYFDYGTWRTAPRCLELEEFVAAVMESWRATGGDADIALQLPQWLRASGFTVREATPVIDAVPASDPAWLWLRTFVEIGRDQLVARGLLSRARAAEIWERVQALERVPGTLMITPGVLEIVAVRQ